MKAKCWQGSSKVSTRQFIHKHYLMKVLWDRETLGKLIPVQPKHYVDQRLPSCTYIMIGAWNCSFIDTSQFTAGQTVQCTEWENISVRMLHHDTGSGLLESTPEVKLIHPRSSKSSGHIQGLDTGYIQDSQSPDNIRGNVDGILYRVTEEFITFLHIPQSTLIQPS